MELKTIIYNTLKKTSIFTITADYIGEEEIRIISDDILKLLLVSKEKEREDDLACYFIDVFEIYNVEIEEKEAEQLARIFDWEYKEFLNHKSDTYDSIMKAETPEHRLEGSTSSETEG